jgi:hypothetical protein
MKMTTPATGTVVEVTTNEAAERLAERGFVPVDEEKPEDEKPEDEKPKGKTKKK